MFNIFNWSKLVKPRQPKICWRKKLEPWSILTDGEGHFTFVDEKLKLWPEEWPFEELAEEQMRYVKKYRNDYAVKREKVLARQWQVI